MFLARRLGALAARPPNALWNLTNSLSTLSITPPQLQQQPQYQQKTAYSTVNKRATTTTAATTPAAEQEQCKIVFNKIQEQLQKGEEGRLFGVVQLCGKQFKVTAGDIILVEGYWPPTNGDQIRLEKVLLAGGRDFTLIGRPILAPGLVDIKATIIEKTLTHTKTHFKKKRRKQYWRINFQRSPNTMIRINSIEIKAGGSDKVMQVDEKRIY